MSTKLERDRVIAIMESDDFDTADKMANALLKETFAINAEGDAWIALTRILANVPFPFETWGPFYDKTAAKKIMQLFDGAVVFMKINGTKSLTDREALAAPPKVAEKTLCQAEGCHHLTWQHWPKKGKYQGCLVVGCSCKQTYKY